MIDMYIRLAANLLWRKLFALRFHMD